MKHLITKAVIYYDEGIENKSIITPNQKVDNVEDYKKELKRLINFNRVYLTFEEVE